MSDDHQNFFINCSEFTLPCHNTRVTHKHCKLCEKSFDTSYKCRRHFKESHLSRVVVVDGLSCYPCKLTHGESGCGRAHYHCPKCEKKVINRNRFAKHYHSHLQPQISEVEIAPSIPKNLKEEGTSPETENVDQPKPKRQKSERRECPTCKKVMDIRSLLRHQRDIHKEIVPSNVCVDETRGIYMVRKSSHGGVAYPVHVQKCVWSPSNVNDNNVNDKQCPFCENNSCRVYMEVAWRSGMKAVECQHIREVGVKTVYKEKVELRESDLKDISHEGTFKLLKEERINQCTSLSQAASSNNAELVVSFEDGERYIHFSVYDGGVHYYSKLGRVIVTCDLKNGHLDCGCCRRKRSCVHKAICLWYLRGEDKLEQFRGIVEDDGDDETEVPNQERPSGIELMCEASKLFYPPDDEDTVANMCKYLKAHKKVPMTANRDKSKAIPQRYTPVEKECPFCNVRLSKPIQITKKATVVTMDSVITNAETYFAKCESCGMCFRYQEHNEGVHNFNDTFLLGLDVCIYLRDSLQCHIPIGSATEVLERSLKTKLNSRLILNAFLHFDALSCHEYKFNCSICGHHPSIITMDLNRKVSFQCPAESLRLPESYKQDVDENDLVDCETFWANVELSMIVRGFPGANVQEFVVKPDLLNWAPFIGSKTRSNNVYNTEHRKVRTEDGKIEEDCREVTEERLLEILHQSTLKDTQSFAKKLGLTGNGSKLDIIMNIKNAVQNNEDKFKKAFQKLWGCSGGWASGTCPHGVVYALKFLIRSESPRDYVDILLSMKHQPNITIVDVANLVAAHGNKRKQEMFSPHNGMLVDPTPENVEKAKARELDISLDWLSSVQETASTERTGHPITGSNDHYCLFDRFHETNPQKEVEVLRRVTHVRQLNGLINTQSQEQLYNVFNRDNRFLNSMTPVNHIFLFRSNIDMMNERINEKNIHNIEQLSSFTVTEAQFGRVVFDKTKKTSTTVSTTKNATATAVSTDESDMLDESPFEPEASETKKSSNTSKPPSVIETGSLVDLTDCPDSPESEPYVFASRPPDKPSDPHVIPEKDESQAVEEGFWIKELGLQITDKQILENGHWINDRIILAVFKILRLQPCTAELGGLQDLIPAVRYGFTKENRKHFVQIINVRGNHWITLSNIKAGADEIRCYDSLVSLNRKGKEISYPINVEQCACRLATARFRFVNMVVTNVQQQKGGSACGLFAIANTIALCFGIDPLALKWNQDNLGPNLMRLFVHRDFSAYLNSTSKPKDTPIRKFLFEWVCWIHCHCAMPDDGKLMGKCKKCKRWFHRSCEHGNFEDPEWKCGKCVKQEEETRKWKEDRQKEREKSFIKFRQASAKYSDRDELVTLYNKLNQIGFGGELYPGEDAVGFLNVQEYNECTGEKLSRPKLGMTYSVGEFIFIVIFRETHTDKLTVFKTLIHEMVHAIMIKRKIKGRSHGKEYKSLGKEVIMVLQANLQEFGKPYCELVINEHEILSARDSS